MSAICTALLKAKIPIAILVTYRVVTLALGFISGEASPLPLTLELLYLACFCGIGWKVVGENANAEFASVVKVAMLVLLIDTLIVLIYFAVTALISNIDLPLSNTRRTLLGVLVSSGFYVPFVVLAAYLGAIGNRVLRKIRVSAPES